MKYKWKTWKGEITKKKRLSSGGRSDTYLQTAREHGETLMNRNIRAFNQDCDFHHP